MMLFFIFIVFYIFIYLLVDAIIIILLPMFILFGLSCLIISRWLSLPSFLLQTPSSQRLLSINTSRLTNVVLTLVYRLKHWPYIDTTFVQCFMFADMNQWTHL